MVEKKNSKKVVEETTQEETKTKDTKKIDWVKMKPSDVESLIVELGKKGNDPAKIGLILRDQHGIPKAKLLGLKIKRVLIKNKVAVKDLNDQVQSKVKNLESHLGKNKQDKSSKKSLAKSLWILAKLNKAQ